MGKHEPPPFKMTVENGRLVPATPYDQERLDSFRRGTTVNVILTRSEQRVGEKKWHAAINRAVKNCKTPWKTAEEASEALKLSLGIVNLSKTITGTWMHYPKSLTDLDDPELDEAVDQMFDLLYGITGVDPAEWRNQTAHVAHGGQGAPQTREAAAGSSGPAEPTIAPDGPTIEQNPASERFPSDPEGGGGDSPVTSAADPSMSISATDKLGEKIDTDAGDLKSQLIGSLKIECIDKLLRLAGEAELTPEQRQENLEFAGGAWRERLPDEHAFIRSVVSAVLRVIKGEVDARRARRYLEGLL